MQEKNFRFDKRAAAYDNGVEGKVSKKFYDALLAQMRPEASASVLDVGCGTGYLLKQMEEHFSITGFGIDVEENRNLQINLANLGLRLYAFTVRATCRWLRYKKYSGSARNPSRYAQTKTRCHEQ